METDIVIQEPIPALGNLVLRLLAPPTPGVTPSSTTTATSALETLRSRASATCVQCGITIRGDELLALVPSASDTGTPPPSPRVARLRLGYCARQGCDSTYYSVRLPFPPGTECPRHPVAGGAEPSGTGRPNPVGGRRTLRLAVAALADSLRAGGFRLAWAATVLVGLAAFRHWYTGGTIPILREPERFEVEVAPDPPRPMAHRARRSGSIPP